MRPPPNVLYISLMRRFTQVLSTLILLCDPDRGNCDGKPRYPDIGLAAIQGMDIYVEGSVIHAAIAGKPPGADLAKLVYMVSKDGGETWSKPVAVSRPGDGKLVARRGDEAQVAARGKQVLVVFRHGGELPGTGPMAVAYSGDGGASWQRGTDPAPGDATRNPSYLDIAADAAGRFHLVWLDDREENGNTQGLRYARSDDGGRRWQKEATVDGAVCTCCWNRVAVLPDQSLAVLYRDDDPHDMRLARAEPGGKSWRSLGAVGMFDWHFSGCPHCGGGIAPGKDGLLHGVVWSGKEEVAGLYYLNSADRGGHWSPPLRIGGGDSRESDIAALADGRVGVVFAGPATGSEGVWLVETADAGKTWTAPKRLSADGKAADHPRIVATPRGFRVFWTEQSPPEGKVWAMWPP